MEQPKNKTIDERFILNYKTDGKTFSLSVLKGREYFLFTEQTPEAVEIVQRLKKIIAIAQDENDQQTD